MRKYLDNAMLDLLRKVIFKSLNLEQLKLSIAGILVKWNKSRI